MQQKDCSPAPCWVWGGWALGASAFPDVSVVLFDCSVRGEEAGFCDVDEHHLSPSVSVFICLKNLVLLLDIAFKIEKSQALNITIE